MAIKSMYPDSINKNSVQDGLEFQDVVSDLLRPYGILVQCYSSKKYQLAIGENPQGIEIKLDNLCTKTGRLSIEIAEKSRASNSQYVPSGIYRHDNTWLYVQGNHEIVYVFSVKLLRMLHKSGRYEEDTMPTISKFYLSLSDADKYSCLVIPTRGNQ